MRKTLILSLFLAILVGCTSNQTNPEQPKAQSPSAKTEPKQPQYETGRTAFQKLYISARMWAPDVKPFRLQSQFTPEALVSEGKADLWRASFASPAKRAMKMFVWSGMVGPDAPEQGVTFSAEDSWNPTNSSTQVFDTAFLKIDSAAAYEVAQKHGGEKLTTKNAKQPVFFVLDWNAPKNELVWHVIYGNSMDESALRIAVNATSGDFLRVEK